jgi:hypothetical protein
VRPWLAKLGAPTLERLNALADEAGLRTESGRPVRFVPPHAADPYYEVHIFETGCVSTRPENRHDLFNALAWLAFPRTKARLNAMHAAEIPREQGRRGRKRDLLTLLDEGGVIVACADRELLDMMRGFRWKELFWQNRGRVRESMRFSVLGHGVLEKAEQAWPGVTCKALPVDPGPDLDARAAGLLAALPPEAAPRDLPVVPVYGYPGWLPESEHPEFYDDTRYFRLSRAKGTRDRASPDPQGLLPDAGR